MLLRDPFLNVSKTKIVKLIEKAQEYISQKIQKGVTSENFDSKDSIVGFFKSLIDGLNYQEFDKSGYKPIYFIEYYLYSFLA